MLMLTLVQRDRSYLKRNHYTLFVAYFCKTRIHTTCHKVENKSNEAKRQESRDIEPVPVETSSSKF